MTIVGSFQEKRRLKMEYKTIKHQKMAGNWNDTLTSGNGMSSAVTCL